MARLAGVDIPNDKRVVISLTYIHGIGRTTSQKLLRMANVNAESRVKDLNDEAVHGIPGKRRLNPGDIVSLDLGLILDGFWADVGCTVPVGKVSSEAERLIKVTEQALHVGIEQAHSGGRLGDISSAVQRHAEAAGFSVIKQFVGHGIGRQMHEDPQVPNFGVPGTGPELRPGMTLAIEPMVNAGAEEVYIKPDGWTVCTSDGSLSAYYEHTVAITKDGPRVLTRSNGAQSRQLAV